ncbi:aminoacyl-tRNA hydrolase [bacterium]|nr:aminoacyl-tRNA hydrolase [bacterium]
MKQIIVGLGNPGRQYDGMRHNVGFAVVDELAEQAHVAWQDKPAWCAQVAAISDTLLVKPQTYMNDSGRAVRAVADYYKVDPEQVCIVVDDRDLDFGDMRFRRGIVTGAHHNGLRSVAKDYSHQVNRLRIGIGNDLLRHVDLQEFVLGRFSHEERAQMKAIIGRAIKELRGQYHIAMTA